MSLAKQHVTLWTFSLFFLSVFGRVILLSAEEPMLQPYNSVDALGVAGPASFNGETYSLAEVYERLAQAEATIAGLQSQLAQRETASDRSVFDVLGDRWLSAGDPEIEIVAFQAGSSATPSSSKKWYERLGLRGYAQFRINEGLTREAGSAPADHVGDSSVGENQNFLIRRARLIVFGDVSDYMYVYLQPDFANAPPGSPDSTFFGQIRDWYADCYLDICKVHRIRIGQSKIPYGWENLQSSSNRIPMDRNDGMNSAQRNERDLGVIYYWTPMWAQDFFKEVMDEGLKGSGNYGVFGIGAYNGQGGSVFEQNDNLHLVTRLTWPIKLASGQHVEIGAQAYSGRYTVLSSPISPLGIGPAVRPAGTLETGNVRGIRDERVGGTFVWYPEPIGFQAEWNVGRGPALNDAQTAVDDRALYGGYAMLSYKLDFGEDDVLFPFLRWNYFEGGHKTQRNAPFSHVEEFELGFEWQLNPQMELVAMYTLTDRTNTNALDAGEISYQQFQGDLARFQFQVNY